MASDVHSGRETVDVTGDSEQDVPVGGDGSAEPGDGAAARNGARAPEAGASADVSEDEARAHAGDAGLEDADAGGSEGTVAEAIEPAGSVESAEPAESAEGTQDAGATEAVEASSAEAGADGADGEDSADSAPAPKRRRTIPILLAVAALALTLDIVSKLIIVATLSDRGPVRLPGGFLYLTLLRNSGAAFSIGESQTWLFTLIAVGVVVAILRVSRRLRSVPWACALGLLLGGALGNLGDRIFRSPGLFRGHVVDFLQFPTFPIVHYDFPVFNLADSAIVVGGCLMVLLSFLGIQPDGTRHAEDAESPEGPEGLESSDTEKK